MHTTLTEQRLIGLARTLTRLRADSPFYRQLIPAGDIGPANAPALLRQLPWLDPAGWAAVREQLRTSTFDGIATGFTNGTSGVPKAFYSTEAERAALRAGRVADGRRRLQLVGFNHGAVVGLDLAGEGDFVPLLSMRYFDLAADLIANGSADGSRVRVLAGTARQIKDLTLHMQQRFGDLAGFGLETLEVGREFLSPGWESRLREWWGAEIDTVYGFSELRMCNALKCRVCAHHHFPPSCVAEVVDPADPDRYVPLGGRGSLLVTALHPYVEFEPRIRYRPGDLVELAAQPCPKWGSRGSARWGGRSTAWRSASAGCSSPPPTVWPSSPTCRRSRSVPAICTPMPTNGTTRPAALVSSSWTTPRGPPSTWNSVSTPGSGRRRREPSPTWPGRPCRQSFRWSCTVLERSTT